MIKSSIMESITVPGEKTDSNVDNNGENGGWGKPTETRYFGGDRYRNGHGGRQRSHRTSFAGGFYYLNRINAQLNYSTPHDTVQNPYQEDSQESFPQEP